MKKILLSLGTLVAVGAIVVGGTIAFYNDTETSTGNIFTAGSIELVVDHLKQSYNGEDCTNNCDTWAKDVESFDQGLKKSGAVIDVGRSDPDEALGVADTSGGNPDPSPTGFVSLGYGGEIVLHFPNGIDDLPGADIRIYEATGGSGSYPEESVDVAVSPNGFDWITIDVDPSNIVRDGEIEIDLDGEAPIVYYVRITDTSDPNIHNDSSDGYDLDAVKAIHCEDEESDGLDSDLWQCRLWEETDLDESHGFFNFADIKPADYGRNVISLHITSNDSYACLIVHDEDDQENTLLEPEVDAGDAPNDGNNDGYGELSDYIDIFAWQDLDADGTYEPDDGEDDLYEGSIQTEIIQMALAGESTNYIGLAWCAGDIQVTHANGANNITCDGNGMLNDAQSDSYEASLTLYAEQQRNNEGFLCENVELDLQ